MKYQKIKKNIREICSKEEIEEFEALVKMVNHDALKTLQELSAKEYVNFYILSCLVSDRYKKDCVSYKLENIDNKEEIKSSIKEEYEELYNKTRLYMSAKGFAWRYGQILPVPKYILGGKSVIEVAKQIYDEIKLNNVNKKISYYLDYINKADEALGKKDQPGEN